MSYILDALKKSDQQRQQGTGPSLQTVHRPLLANNDSPLLKTIVILLAVLLLVLVVGAGWYVIKGAGNIQPQQTVKPEAVMNNHTPVVNEVIKNERPAQHENIQYEPNSPTKSKQSAVRFNDLDANTRAAIPSLTFSFHVYSDNPKRRTIIINNRRIKEGELIEKSLLLEEITAVGVLLIWRDETRFSIDVVEAW